MKLNSFLYRNAILYFILFFLFALIAFWPNYFSDVNSDKIKPYLHIHGITMILWCLMLITQAALIRYKKFNLHTVVGKFSYILAPLILITGFNTAHATISRIETHSGPYYSSVALMFNSLILFAIIYSMAMYNKDKPLIHARCMVCTLFPMFTPLTDRLIYFNFRSTVSYFPTIEGMPMVWLFGFGLANLILISLIVLDWKSKKHRNVFLLIFVLNLIYDISVSFFYKFSAWRSISDWIMELPLS